MGCDNAATDPAGSPFEFSLRAPGADAVFLEGTFNAWAPRDPKWALSPAADSVQWSLSAPDLPSQFTYHYAVYAQGRMDRVQDPRGAGAADVRLAPFQTRVDRSYTRPLPLSHPMDVTGLVIYEVMVSDFSDAGTFAEIEASLDAAPASLVELGINAIELMPVHPVPGDFSWGYDTGSFFSVEPGYGGLDGLRDLVDACHERGIAVILDIVLNHVGGHHPIRRIEQVTGIPYFFDPSKTNPFGLPEFDWTHPEVIDYFTSALRHFILELGIDGFRYDYVSGEPYENWAQVVLPLKAEFPHVLHIAEDFSDLGGGLDPEVGFDAQWGGQSSSYGGRVNRYFQRLNVNLAEKAYVDRYGGVIGDFNVASSPMLATADVTTFHPSRGPWRDIKNLESHDERRLIEQVESSGSAGARRVGGKQKSRLGALSLFTSVGIPMLYHGQEIGVGNPITPTPSPSPIDWVGADLELREFYRHLIHLRLQEPALRSEAIEFIWEAGHAPSAPDEARRTLQYVRGDPGEQVLVALNFDHDAHQIELSFPVGTEEWIRFDPLTGSREHSVAVPADGRLNITLPASSGQIYLQP